MNEPKPNVPFVDGATQADIGFCSRWINHANCGQPATTHVIWNQERENGFVCQPHADETLNRWAYVAMHAPEPGTCGHPGTHFHDELNVCYWPPGESAPLVLSARRAVSDEGAGS